MTSNVTLGARFAGGRTRQMNVKGFRPDPKSSRRQVARFADPGFESSENWRLAICQCPRTSVYSQGVQFRDRKRQNGL